MFTKLFVTIIAVVLASFTTLCAQRFGSGQPPGRRHGLIVTTAIIPSPGGSYFPSSVGLSRAGAVISAGNISLSTTLSVN